MNTDAYTQFKLAFLDQVAMKGYDADFIEGFFKRAEEEYSRWEQLVTNAYKGDRDLCKQAYAEVAFGLASRSGEKQANTLGPELLGLLDQLGGNVGKLFGQQAGAGLGGGIVGSGGGMLVGLLLSQLFDIPLPMAMMLGALGGGALGYGAAGTQAGQSKFFGVNPPGPPPVDPAGEAGLDAAAGKNTSEEVTPAPKPTPTPAPASTAAAGVAKGQQVADAAAAGAPAAPPPAPAAAPPARPVVPPQTAPAAGGAVPPPGVQPPPAPAIKPPELK